jgi:hypothetical protein
MRGKYMELAEENDLTDSEWEKRVLCRDERCIGVIGEDGRCKECGLPYIDTRTDNSTGLNQSQINAAEIPLETETTTDTETVSGADWDNRVLCRDGNCIGVIGADGRCKECGKPY